VNCRASLGFTFHEGEVEDFKRLSEQGMNIVQIQDTGTCSTTLASTMTSLKPSLSRGTGISEALIEHLAHIGND
jgi:hypothetical protein